jgi:hypothetical protein
MAITISGSNGIIFADGSTQTAGSYNNIITHTSSQSNVAIPAGATKMFAHIAGAGGSGSSSFQTNGIAGGNSSLTYNGSTHTAYGGSGAKSADGNGGNTYTATANATGTSSTGTVIQGGGGAGGESGQTITNGYASNPEGGAFGGLVIVEIPIVSGQTTYDVVVGAGGTSVSGTYQSDTGVSAVGADGYVMIYFNGGN